MKHIIEFFKYLFRPSFWLQNTETDLVWDKKLNELLDNEKIQDISYATVTIGKLEVWIGNYPYAYGSLYNRNDLTGLPKRSTRERLRQEVLKFVLNNK